MTFKRLAAAAALLAAFAMTASAADEQSIRDNLMKKTGLRAETVRPAPISGLWEVIIQDRLFYVDDSVDHVVSGMIVETETQKNLTQASLKRHAKESWSKWPFKDAIKQVFGDGSREVIVFSDANCTFCRQMERVFEQVGNVTVYTFVTPMIRGIQNNREIVCSKDPADAWHKWMGQGIRPADAPAGCDASILDRNLRLVGRYNITGAPTFFFPTGDRRTGAMPAEDFEAILAQQTATN